MGNNLGGRSNNRKSTTDAKIMMIDGEMFRMKTPVQAGEVVKKYPAGYVLLESEAVKHYGIRAKPLEPRQELEPKRLYFLVELPNKVDEEENKLLPGVDGGVMPRRVRSGIHMSAKDRLESLKLARRSTSDLCLMKQTMMPNNNTASSSTMMFDEDVSTKTKNNNGGSSVRLKMRLPKAEVAKLLQESQNEAEAAQKIMDLCMAKNNNNTITNDVGQQQAAVRLKSGHEIIRTNELSYKKRVSFMPVNEGEIIQLPMGGGAPGIESW